MKVKIREIFSSIQGEGPYVGYKQLFVRFCKCNLSCDYCDTDFDINFSKEYSTNDLIEICNKNKECHSISLTGGEPLLETEFLKEFLPQCPLPVYLETNATLPDKLNEVINFVDFVSADIKLESSTHQPAQWNHHDRFFDVAKDKILFAKVVFDNQITQEEILNVTNLCKKYNFELILQPKMKCREFTVTSAFMLDTLSKFLQIYPKVRLIPQIHKYIQVD